MQATKRRVCAADYEDQMVAAYRNAWPAHRAWSWADVPEDVLRDANWLSDFTAHRRRKAAVGIANAYMEYGLDGAADCGDGAYVGLQAKHREVVDGNDIGTFQTVVKVMRDGNARNRGALYHSGRVTPAVNYAADVFGFSTHHLPFRMMAAPPSDTPPRTPPPPFDSVTLRPYQRDAVDAVLEWFHADADAATGVLAMPPGTGKTEIIKTVIGTLQAPLVVVLSETIALSAQTAARVGGALVDCRHAREMPSTGTVCCTFDSAGLVDPSAVSLLVVDEAHNLTEESDAGRLASACGRVLMMSGTPPTSFGDIQDLPLIYNMSLREAISTGAVCDYEVLLPVPVDTALSWDQDDEFLQRAAFLLTAVERCGVRACIVYVNRIASADVVIRAVRRECRSHGRPFWGESITCDTSDADRLARLRRFDGPCEPGEVRILVAVRILDEGIDLPGADAVFFAEPAERLTNARRQVQRLCRANRKDARNPHKLARALVWADVGALTDLLMALKEYDVALPDRVRCISSTYEPRMSVETEAAATAAAQRCAVGVRTLALVPRMEKIRFMIEKYSAHPPVRTATTAAPWDPLWKAGSFLDRLRSASRGLGTYTALTAEERAVLDAASPLYLSQKPSRLHMIQFMIETYGARPPVKGTVVAAPWVPVWKVGQFIQTLRRVSRGMSRCAALTAEERAVLDAASPYYLNPPSRLHMIQFMIETYGARPPTSTAAIEAPWDPAWKVGKFITTLRSTSRGMGGGAALTAEERTILNAASPRYLNP